METSLDRWRLGDPRLLDEAQAHLQIKDILLLIQEYYPPSITWNEEQERALALMDGNKSLFLSGEAGTGKSRLVREMIRRSQQSGIKFAITASTGIAAVPIGGRTLHSWAGIGLGKENVDSLCARIRKYKKTRRGSPYERWTKTHRLFIDEVSMISAEFFEKLDDVAKALRGNSKPFGGLQLILVGDFFQLPPVDRASTLSRRYLFTSESWLNAVDAAILLTQVYRQSDTAFVDLLRRARNAALNADDIRLLRSKVTRNGQPPAPREDGLVSPLLHPYRSTVERENIRRLEGIRGRCFRFERKLAHLTVRKHQGQGRMEVVSSILQADLHVQETAKKLAAGLQAQAPLLVKIGAPVMLLVNLDQDRGLVNGLRGMVVGAGRALDTSLAEKEEEEGQETVFKGDDERVWVRFENSNVPIALERHTWKQPLLDSESTLSPELWTEWVAVSQIPLALAAACSIHKAQGCTLTAAHISLGEEIFEDGQAYVALSRLSGLEQLTLAKFSPRAFRTNQVVKEYYALLKEASQTTTADVIIPSLP
jgi:ATP-dependent DNA helicase PIF1